jgi:hypothetical protein
MKALYALALCATMLASKTAFAGDFIIWGEGNSSCGTFIQERAKNSARFRAEMSWIAGSVTHGNGIFGAQMMREGIKADILEGLDNPALEAWLTRYCQENPLKLLNSAAMALESALLDRLHDNFKAEAAFRNAPASQPGAPPR